MSKLTETALATIVNEAFDTAEKETNAYLAREGDRDACGFAWVIIKPANCQLAKYLTKIDKGRKAYGGGIQVWNPSGNFTQAITAKEIGARAFVEVIRKHMPEVNISSDSRMD